jgi:uncharacterized protein
MDTKNLMGEETTPVIPPTSDEKTMAILSHVLCLVPGLGFIPPLIIYLVKKDESAYVSEHAKESLNFQISLLIICIILFVTLIGILLIWVVGILNLIFVIIATIKASENKMYKYPFNLRLIK